LGLNITHIVDQVSHEGIKAAHREVTLARASREEGVLLVEETSNFN
jgi:hypothetical protein